MAKDNGGYAFPGDGVLGSRGMTLRDYFAGQALAGMLSHRYQASVYGEAPEEKAAAAYRMADAMLAEREK